MAIFTGSQTVFHSSLAAKAPNAYGEDAMGWNLAHALDAVVSLVSFIERMCVFGVSETLERINAHEFPTLPNLAAFRLKAEDEALRRVELATNLVVVYSYDSETTSAVAEIAFHAGENGNSLFSITAWCSEEGEDMFDCRITLQ